MPWEPHAQEIREYLTQNGSNPFRSWLIGLKDNKIRGRIRARLNRLRLGNFGDCKSVGDGVQELRLPFGPGYRIYFGRIEQRLVLLLCGGDKSTQSRDIARAKSHWADYKERIQ